MGKRQAVKRERGKRTALGGAGVTLERRLLTGGRTADVESVESDLARLAADRPLDNECRVVLFELPGDVDLHVDVIHQYPARAAAGEAGPGTLVEGYVHNRRFGDTPRSQIVRQVREMVFAGRPGSRALSGITD